jgi:hypothetical protein
MISHEHKCIFVHIPRTAGTSIEAWIQGGDQWAIAPKEKHLTSSQAKFLYHDFWHDYFKFSIVRHPIQRVFSCMTYAEHFGLSVASDGSLNMKSYIDKFGHPLTIEHDHRFTTRDYLLNLSQISGYAPLSEHCVYSNLLNEELDRIYRFEDLASAIKDIASTINLDPSAFPWRARSTIDAETPEMNASTDRCIRSIYGSDFEKYDYA